MFDSKLFKYLKLLNRQEINEFGDYLESKFFKIKKRDKCLQLYNIIKKAYPNWNSSTLRRDKVCKKMYSHLSENKRDGSLRNQMSLLSSHVEDYIKIIKYKKDKSYKNRSFIEFFRESLSPKNFQEDFWQNQKHELSNLNQSKLRDSNYHYNQYCIEYYLALDLETILQHFDYYTIIVKLKLYCAMINRRNIKDIKPNLRDMNELLVRLENTPQLLSREPVIHIYYTILLMFKETDNVNHYFKFKKLLFENSDSFSKTELSETYKFGVNYGTQKIRQGDEEYYSDTFELYQFAEERNLLINSRSIIQKEELKNIVSLGSRLGKFDWTEEIINKYKENVEVDYQDVAFHFHLATLYFYKGIRENKNIETAKEYFSNAENELDLVNREKREFVTLYYRLDYYSLLLKVYYELNEYDRFLSLQETAKATIKKRKEASKNRIDEYINFMVIFKKLFDYKERNQQNTRKKDKIRVAIESINVISNKRWLLEKLEELK